MWQSKTINQSLQGKSMNKLFRAIRVYTLCLISAACGNPDSNTAPVAAANADQVFKWKMITTWPANFPIFQEEAENFAREVKVMSRGRLDIQVYAGGELVPALQVFDAVSQGIVQMGHGSAYYWAGKIPEAQFFSSVPFGMTARGTNAWFYNGGGLELWRDVYRPFNVIPFPMGNTGVQMGGWFNKKIESLSDLKGLRMRIPGLGGKVLKKAGGNPVLMAGGEIYTALERGAIDATEWVAPFHDLRLGLNRAADYYYYPGWHEPGTAFELIININNWQQLPEDLQHIVDITAIATNQRIYAQMEYQNQKALQQLEQKQNVEVLPFPAEILEELKTLTKATMDEEAAKNANFKKIYQAYDSFRKNYEIWSSMSDDAYTNLID